MSVTHFIGAVHDNWHLFSDNPNDYIINDPIGFGASSIVYSALFRPLNIPCALKVLDLDSLPPRSLLLLQRETALMSLSKHPNVLRVRGSWTTGHKLYIALRLMNKGSAADVMRYAWPAGMQEDVVRCILAQALKGLNYLHINGFIHRDIKAANLLIDDDGTVLLGDLGVAADLSEDSSPSMHSNRPSIRKRKSFVGTPCWMAPELIQGRQYDSSADIWSFGITALELCQGRPPRSREPAQSVLIRTIQDDSPTLDREGSTHKYSRAFKEMVDSCLVKDPSKRPTAEELLQTPFFKAAKKKSYLINAILKDLPPLTERQERRPLNNHGTLHTVDSWDFVTTVGSRTVLGSARAKLPTVEPSTDDAVFEMEEDWEQDAKGNDSNSPLKPLASVFASLPYPTPDASQHPLSTSAHQELNIGTKNVAFLNPGSPSSSRASQSNIDSPPLSNITTPITTPASSLKERGISMPLSKQVQDKETLGARTRRRVRTASDSGLMRMFKTGVGSVRSATSTVGGEKQEDEGKVKKDKGKDKSKIGAVLSTAFMQGRT